MTPDFRVFQVLQSHRIPFLIIGGHAVSFHGYVRGTEDADILWDRTHMLQKFDVAPNCDILMAVRFRNSHLEGIIRG